MATGRITTIIEGSPAEAKEPSKKLLKLSKGEELEGSSSEDAISVQDKIRSMEENAIAREKALNEINERIALLEKNIKQLRHLLELKSPTMAEAQEQAENTTPYAELSSSTVVSPMVDEPSVASVQGDEPSSSAWQWLWAAILLPIVGWGWKLRKASKNSTLKSFDTN